MVEVDCIVGDGDDVRDDDHDDRDLYAQFCHDGDVDFSHSAHR